MTILEAIKSNPLFVDILESSMEFALSSRTVDGSATYIPADLKGVELVTADLYENLVLSPEFREGQLSVKLDKEELKKRSLQIYRKYNDEKAKDYEPKPLNIGVKFE